MLVGEPSESEWSELTLPLRGTEITSVVPDPFSRDRYFLGTLGEGVWVYEGKMRRYVPQTRAQAATAAAGGSQ